IGSRHLVSSILGPLHASPSRTQGGSRMLESGLYGSVRGALSNERPYRDRPLSRTMTKSWDAARGGRGNLAGDPRNDAVPIARRGLTVEPHARVPRAVVAVEQPAPIGREGDHDPGRSRQRAGEMDNRGVD